MDYRVEAYCPDGHLSTWDTSDPKDLTEARGRAYMCDVCKKPFKVKFVFDSSSQVVRSTGRSIWLSDWWKSGGKIDF